MSTELLLTPQQAIQRWLVQGLDQDDVLPFTGHRSIFSLYEHISKTKKTGGWCRGIWL